MQTGIEAKRLIEEEALGKAMFESRVHGSCTSYAIYLGTIFRALGIPTRTLVFVPPYDPNDIAQQRMFFSKIANSEVRDATLASLVGQHGFIDHIIDEIYIQGHWHRVNYDRLDQTVLDGHYLGLMTHIYTYNSFADSGIPKTWGMRFFKYPATGPRLTSINPYRLLHVEESFGHN
jgi:hypothetical protein